MIRPVKTYSIISTQFGSSPDPGIFGKHAGTDYACPIGTSIYAPFSGKVTQSFDGSTAGGQIEITDSTYSSRTLHMSRRDVAVGDRVSEGQQVGLSGASGSKSTGPHCHWDVRKAGTAWDSSFSNYFDPEQLIKGEDMVTKALLELLYKGVLGREPDASANARIGQPVDVALTQLIQSPEWAARQAKVEAAGSSTVNRDTVLNYVQTNLK